MSAPRWLTTKEAAQILREHPVTTSRKCKDGTIPATKTGKSWRISEAALAAYLEPTNQEPAEEPTYLTAAEKRRALKAAS